MIELHRPDLDAYSDEISEKLVDMVVAHRTHIYRNANSSEAPLPFIREGNKIISGKENTDRFLSELEFFMNVQRSVSSDSCYIDPETGNTC
ncbi:MAG: hypothetical protein WD097_01450 [Balneolales bacterium]